MRDSKEYTIFSAQAGIGTSKVVQIHDAEKVVVSFATSGSANLTVKFQGSIQETTPDFSAAQSVSNHWDYIEIIDLEDGQPIEGDNGITLTGIDDVRLFEVNVGHLQWFCATVTARSAGSVTIKVRTID